MICEAEFEADGPVIDSYTYSYDKYGNNVEEHSFDSKGTPIKTESKKYNEKNLCISEILIKDNYKEITTFKYNNNNAIVEEEQTGNGKLIYFIAKGYDYKGRIVFDSSVFNFSKLDEYVHIWQYDSTHLLEEIRMSSGKIVQRTTFHFNALGQEVEKTEHGFGDTVRYSIFSKYENTGELLEETEIRRKPFDSNYGKESCFYQTAITKFGKFGNRVSRDLFDEKKRLVRHIEYLNLNSQMILGESMDVYFYYDKKGKIAEKIFKKRDYDVHGKCTVEQTKRIKGNGNWDTPQLDPNYKYGGFKATHEYTYDKIGNMIKQVDYVNGAAELMTENEIEYY